MVFKCKNCGGNTVYSPERHKMFCPYCDSEESHERQELQSDALHICPNCGGELQVSEHVSALQCPYCDNYFILDERVEGEFAPQLILPFQLGKEHCKKILREKFEHYLFAPTDFLTEAKLNEMQGIYVPYWFYDYDVTCDYQAEGTKIRTWTSGNMQYTERSFYEVQRNLNIDFSKIPVDASIEMPDDVMDLMEPFGYEQLEDFKPELLSGFHAEKYNMPSSEVESRAKQKMQEDVQLLLKDTYSGYHNVREIRNEVGVRDTKVQYGLLPVWRYQYRYQNQMYCFYVNGQTGKIVGMAPFSKKKVWLYAGTIWASITSLLLIAQAILRLLA